MADGVFPDFRATGPKARAEETRNAFVAATRSRRLLYLTYPQTRVMPWGDVRRQRPSEFISGAQP
jgi:DNA helicase-2/ATP-dependent DNA helicase PcrA